MSRIRRTKIIATLGPAADDPKALNNLLSAGVDLVRINFSHGVLSDHKKRIVAVRLCSEQIQRPIGIVADLQGPKIRIACFQQGKVTLTKGQTFILDAKLDNSAGNAKAVGIDYKNLPNDVKPDDCLLLDDGRIELIVQAIKDSRISCHVISGGELSNNKGINRRGGGLSAQTLTDKDRFDLKSAIDLGVDYIAVSFPRNANDISQARKLIHAAKGQAGIIAKIERTEAIDAIDEIILASDAVMVARGDLGVELGDAELPGVQKYIIQRARSLDKAVITATQMMESMIYSPIPTRAEVSDVANAVLDGTDAVMLSAETATGAHPHKVVEAMARICLGAERQQVTQISKHRLECQFKRIDEVIAMSAVYAANHMSIKAIVSLTESGSTPLWMSRIRTGIPIYALTRNVTTERRVTLYRGVYPIHFDVTKETRDTVNDSALHCLKSQGALETGDLVILTKGNDMGKGGGTNVINILRVE